MKKRQLKAVVAVVLVGAAAFGVWRWRSAAGQPVSQAVQTVAVATGTVEPVLAVTGAVAADQRAVNASASGRIVEIYVKQGDVVTAGQKLFRLDGASAQQDVNIAWANLKSARAKSGRLDKITGDKLTLTTAFGSVKVTLDKAAKIKLAKAATSTDLKVGSQAIIQGAAGADGQLTAKSVIGE